MSSLQEAAFEKNEDLSPEAIKVVIQADQLVGPFVADSDPTVLESWLSVRTLAYSVYESDESSEVEVETSTRPISPGGTVRPSLPPSPSKPPASSQLTLDDIDDMDEGDETASKKKQKRKITVLGPIKSPSKSQEDKTVASSSKTAKVALKPSVEHELFVTGRHTLWPKSVSSPFSSSWFA